MMDLLYHHLNIMVLMSTSPGKFGGVNNRKLLERILPHLGVDIAATF